MREVKFQAWDNVNRKMYGVGEQEDMHFYFDSSGIKAEWFFSSAGDSEILEHLIYRQYTGLKDKNGKEIFQGDILHIDKRFNGSDIYGKVYWKDSGYALITSRGSDTSTGYLEIVSPYTEIVGNIYENPELMEE